MRRYDDRAAAGRHLAPLVRAAIGEGSPVVIGLPRGGVPVAAEVAWSLRAPLDVLGVRRLVVPGHEELAVGAIATHGAHVLNQSVLRALRIPWPTVEAMVAHQQGVLAEREALWRGGRAPIPLTGRTVVIVDDGLATGSTMRVAIGIARSQGAARIVAAVPVGSRETCRELTGEADQVVCPWKPEPFLAVGLWYLDFPEVPDEAVASLLATAAAAV
jgi:predicted phosphoribosyltransferase